MGGHLRRCGVDRSETARTVKEVNNSMEGRKCIRQDTQMEWEHKREGRHKQSGSRSLVGVVEGIPVCGRRVSEEGEVTLGCEYGGRDKRRVSRGLSVSASRHLSRVIFMAILYLNPAGAYLLEEAGIPTYAWLTSLLLIAISGGISLIRRCLQKDFAKVGRHGGDFSLKVCIKRLFALVLMLMGGYVAASEGVRVLSSINKLSDEGQFGRYDKEISYGSWLGSGLGFEQFLVGDGVAEAIIGMIRGMIIFVGGAGMQVKQTGYKRSWKRKVLFTAGCSLLPLIAVTCIAIKTHEMDDKESKFGTLSDQQILDEYNMIVGRHQKYDLNRTVNTGITEVITVEVWNREVSDYMDSDIPLRSCLGEISSGYPNFEYKIAPAFRLYGFSGNRLWGVECPIMHMLYTSELNAATCARYPRICKERNGDGPYVTNFKYAGKYGAEEGSTKPLFMLLFLLTGLEFMITAHWVFSRVKPEYDCCYGKCCQWLVWILISAMSVGMGILSLVMFADGNFQPPSKIRIGGVMARLGVYDFGWQKIVAFLITLIFDVASALGAVDDVTAEAAEFGVNVADAVGV